MDETIWEQPLGRLAESIDLNYSPTTRWGTTAQEAADALAVLVGGSHDPFELLRFMRSLGETEPTISPQEVGCVGYEEL
jgi:hypothetical protein